MSKKIVVSVSGGKDSTASLIIALNEHKKEDVIPVFADTGWEHPLTYQYLEYLESKLGIKITRVKSKKYADLLDVIEKKKTFPSARRRHCTDVLKREPQFKFIEELLNQGYEVEQWIGIRADESRNRTERYGHLNPEDVFDVHEIFPSLPKKFKGVKVRFPVVNLTAKQIYKIIAEAGLEINPLYHKGFKRVGCFPCVMGSLQDFRNVWSNEIGKQNILKLVNLEEKLNKQGYATTLKPDKSAQEILEMLKMRDKQSLLFSEDETTMCGFCHY